MAGLKDLLNSGGGFAAMVPIEDMPIPEEMKAFYRSQGIRGLSREAAESIISRQRQPTINYPKSLGLSGLLPPGRGAYEMFPQGMDARAMGLTPALPVIPNTEGQGDLYPSAPSPRAPTARRQTLMRVPTGWEEGPSPEVQNPYEGITGNEGRTFREGPRDSTVAKQDPRLSGPLALLAAGLGILGSKSPYGLQAIGEGGLKGIETYAKLSQAEKDTALKERIAAVQEKNAETERMGTEALARIRGLQAQLEQEMAPDKKAKLQADVEKEKAMLATIAPDIAYKSALTEKARVEAANIPDQRRDLALTTARLGYAKLAADLVKNNMLLPEQEDAWVERKMAAEYSKFGITPPSLGNTKIVPGSTWSPQGWIPPK